MIRDSNLIASSAELPTSWMSRESTAGLGVISSFSGTFSDFLNSLRSDVALDAIVSNVYGREVSPLSALLSLGEIGSQL